MFVLLRKYSLKKTIEILKKKSYNVYNIIIVNNNSNDKDRALRKIND